MSLLTNTPDFVVSSGELLIVDPGYCFEDGLLIPRCLSGAWSGRAASEQGRELPAFIEEEFLFFHSDYDVISASPELAAENVTGDFGIIGIYDACKFPRGSNSVEAAKERLQAALKAVEEGKLKLGSVDGRLVCVWDSLAPCYVYRTPTGQVGCISICCGSDEM